MRGLTWPLLLIVLGIALLAANFGLVAPIDIGRLIAFGWPVVLIVVGIDLALSRRWPTMALALQIGAIVVAVVLAATLPTTSVFLAGAPGVSTVTVPREGATGLDLSLDLGAATVNLSGSSTALVEASSDRADLRSRTTRRATDRTSVSIDQTGSHLVGGSASTIDVRVPTDLPLTIDLDGGAGTYTLDLRDVRATRVNVDAGASTIRLVLPRPTGTIPIEIDGGAMTIEIEVPAGVEARVAARGGLVTVNGRTETPGYATATDRVAVEIEGGALTVNIR